MNDKEIIQEMRETLVAVGDASLVKLTLVNGFFTEAFVKDCINSISMMNVRIMLGENPSPLERLAIRVLMDSANIANNV
jgi:hypothetical protein